MNTRITSKFFPPGASTRLLAGAVVLALITGCSQQPTIPEATGSTTTGTENTGSGTNTQGVNVGNGGGVSTTGSADYNSAGKVEYTLANLNNPHSLLSQRIIYFDYNQSTIKPEYQAVLDAHTKLLAGNLQIQVRLEGHADERGTREYNVALSEERGKAVQWMMRSKGVQAVAYGEERPAIVGDGEKSWAQNRRVEIKYPGR